MSKVHKRTGYRKGVLAEYAAAIFLIFKGYRICARRYKSKFGETDLVARKKSCHVFIEVKYRSDYDTGVLSISPRSQERIQRAAQHYLLCENIGQDSDMRFDAVIISPPFYVRHLINAWTS